MKKSNPIALLPIGVFLVIYLGLGIVFECRSVFDRPAGRLPAESGPFL